jgi:hypothetical protein
MSNQFFVILPSDTPGYDDNRPNRFRVHLPKPLDFQGNWLAALHSICYPISWHNLGSVDEQWMDIYLRDDRKIRVPIPKNSFITAGQIEEKLQESILIGLDEHIKARKGENRFKRSTTDPSINEFFTKFPNNYRDHINVEKDIFKDLQTKVENAQREKAAEKNSSKLQQKIKELQRINNLWTNQRNRVELLEEEASKRDEQKRIRLENEDVVEEVLKEPVEEPPLLEPVEEQTQQTPVAPLTPKQPATPLAPPTPHQSATPTPLPPERPAPPVTTNTAAPGAEKEPVSSSITPPPIPPVPINPVQTENAESEPVSAKLTGEEFINFVKSGGKSTEKSDEEKPKRDKGQDFIDTVTGRIRFKEYSRENVYFPDRITNDEIIDYVKAIKFQQLIALGKFKVEFGNDNISHVALSPQLGYMLGFVDIAKIWNGEVAKYSPELRGGITSFCVYAKGLTENIIMGNELVSLLRVVAVTGKPGDVVEKIYDSPMYTRVLPKQINEIEIELRTLEGRLVPFQYGTTLLTLVFKRVIYL